MTNYTQDPIDSAMKASKSLGYERGIEFARLCITQNVSLQEALEMQSRVGDDQVKARIMNRFAPYWPIELRDKTWAAYQDGLRFGIQQHYQENQQRYLKNA